MKGEFESLMTLPLLGPFFIFTHFCLAVWLYINKKAWFCYWMLPQVSVSLLIVVSCRCHAIRMFAKKIIKNALAIRGHFVFPKRFSSVWPLMVSYYTLYIEHRALKQMEISGFQKCKHAFSPTSVWKILCCSFTLLIKHHFKICSNEHRGW